MRRKKQRYMWFCLFCLGLMAGTVLVNYMVKTEMMDTSILIGYIRQLEKKQFEDIYFFIYLCISRLASFLVLTILAAAFKTPVLLGMVTAVFGGAFGCMISMSALAYGYKGILMAAVLLFPQYIIYVPLYIFLLKMVDNNRFDDTIGHTSVYRRNQRRTALMTALAVLIIFGCALESYVNPFLVAHIQKYF